jgi:hypothetical protein
MTGTPHGSRLLMRRMPAVKHEIERRIARNDVAVRVRIKCVPPRIS